MTYTGTKHRREKTKGVDVIFQWKDGRKTQVTLKDTKNSYPVYMSKYVVHCCISGDPEFAWWIRHVLEKRNDIIGELQSKYRVRTKKIGVKISK